MEYRRMGRSGLKVSELCLGTMTFGHGADETEAGRMVDLALDAGINFFDSADSYGEGESERLLGKALKGRRRGAVVATKFFNPMGPGPNDSGMSRVHIMEAIEDSLQRLQMDYVDLYYIHHVDTQTPVEEMLRAMDDLVHQGKVRYIGCSNYQAWRLCDALWISESNGLARFECFQPQYSLVVRDIEQELVPLCREKGLGVVVWSPMGGGFLTGKYKPGERSLAGTRSEESWAYPQRYFAQNADETLETLLAVCKDLGKEPSQVAVRWVVEQPGVTSAIVGARNAEQLRSNLGAAEWRLPEEAMERLSGVSHLADRYPEAMEKNIHERRDDAVDMPSLG
ncbi:MAG: aldo/keto reductase [Candidatus Latescibacteria bacterium]|jgi:aryl-alcohol dehydrogenase-like predicted oxidoreductase|nr:aldo/keto reductase [Candidatus Latescibacterota bacterium]